MKSFLVKNKRPLIKWGMLPDNIFYEGAVPEGYDLAISPSKGFIIVDIDKHGDKNGFNNIPNHLLNELENTLNYPTKNDGKHYWLRYTGTDILANKASKYSIDLRTHKGYVVWYPSNDVRDVMSEVKESSPELNEWLLELFGFIKK